MKSLQIDEKKALKLYPTASNEFKEMLTDSFGKGFFSQKITDRVKTFDDILEIAGITLYQLINTNDTVDEIAYKQAKLIAKVYNEGTVLDAMNTSQYKYYPWHRITPGSGFGLSYHVYADWRSTSYVGVRLCFKSEELAIDAGKKFLEIYANLKIK